MAFIPNETNRAMVLRTGKGPRRDPEVNRRRGAATSEGIDVIGNGAASMA